MEIKKEYYVKVTFVRLIKNLIFAFDSYFKNNYSVFKNRSEQAVPVKMNIIESYNDFYIEEIRRKTNRFSKTRKNSRYSRDSRNSRTSGVRKSRNSIKAKSKRLFKSIIMRMSVNPKRVSQKMRPKLEENDLQDCVKLVTEQNEYIKELERQNSELLAQNKVMKSRIWETGRNVKALIQKITILESLAEKK